MEAKLKDENQQKFNTGKQLKLRLVKAIKHLTV